MCYSFFTPDIVPSDSPTGVGAWPFLQRTCLEILLVGLEVAWGCAVCFRSFQQPSVFLFQLPPPSAVQKAITESITGRGAGLWLELCWSSLMVGSTGPPSVPCPTQMLPWLPLSPLPLSSSSSACPRSLVMCSVDTIPCWRMIAWLLFGLILREESLSTGVLQVEKLH